MSNLGQNSSVKKALLTAVGLVVLLATSTPQTTDVASAYLAKRGYTEISIKAPEDY